MAKKIFIVVAGLACILFSYNQYQQAQALQTQQRIEAQTQKEHVEMVKKLEEQANKPVPPPRRGIY